MPRQTYTYITTIELPEHLTIDDWRAVLEKIRAVGWVKTQDVEESEITFHVAEDTGWKCAVTVSELSSELEAITGLPLNMDSKHVHRHDADSVIL